MVDGHLRVAEALSHSQHSVPVLHADPEPEEEALVLASLDTLAAMAGTHDQKLRSLLAGVTVNSTSPAARWPLEDLKHKGPLVKHLRSPAIGRLLSSAPGAR